MTYFYNLIIDLKCFVKRNFTSFIIINLLLLLFAMWGVISATNSNVQDFYDNSSSLFFAYIRGEGGGFLVLLCIGDILLLAMLLLLSFNSFLQRWSILLVGLKVAYIIKISCYAVGIFGFFSIVFILAILLLQAITCFIYQIVYIYIKSNGYTLSDLICCKDNSAYFVFLLFSVLVTSILTCLFFSFLN